jgi:hypothetical protein
MTHGSDLKAIRDSMHEFLQASGFRRYRSAWTRHVGDLVDVVDLQPNRSGERVWVNLGVAEPMSFELSWGARIRDPVDEGMCTIRARLGALVDDLDRPWLISDAATATSIIETMRSHGLPFLDQFHELPALESHLASRRRDYPPEKIALAAIRWRLGRKDEACAGLAGDARGGVGAWHDRIEEAARRIGCDDQ